MDNVKAFHKQLKSIYEGKPPVSKAKMAFITKAAFKAIKFYKHVVLEVEKFALKAPTEYKLAALYVIDSIVRQSRHQNGHENDVFGPRFAKNIRQTFINILQCNVEDKSKVVKVLNLWQKNGTFPTELVQMLIDLSNPNNTDLKLTDRIDGSMKKSQKEFAEEALKVVDDLLEKCGKDPQGMGINPQHYQQLEIIGRYLKQQLDNKNHKLDGSDGNSITVDAKVVTQLRELAAQLFGKVNNTHDHQLIASKNDKTKQSTPNANEGGNAKKEQTVVKDINNDVALSGFNKKLLDFDYGDEDDESPSYNNNGSLNSKGPVSDSTANFSSLPPIDPTIKEAAQKIFNDPGIMRELQNMTPLMCDASRYSDDLRKQILAQQQEEFDKEIQNSVKGAASNQFQYIPGLSPQQNSFSTSYTNNSSYTMNHLKTLNFMSSSSSKNLNYSQLPPIPSSNLKDVPLPTLPCPFPAYNKSSTSNFAPFSTPSLGGVLDGQTDYLRYKSIAQVDADYRPLDHDDERHQSRKSNDVPSSGSKDHRRTSVSRDREHRGEKRERGRDGDRNNSKSARDYDSDKRLRHKDSSPVNNSRRGSEREDRDRRGRDGGSDSYKKRSRETTSDKRESSSQRHKSSSNASTYQGPVAPKADCITVLSRTLWIGRVPKNSTEADLKQAFKEYNITAESIQMVPPRGCAYVTFNTRHDAAKILDRMKDKYKLFGKTLQVNWSPFKGLKDRKNLKQCWSESLGVYYLPYDKVEIAMVNDYNDGGIVEWDSVPSTLKVNMQGEMMKLHQNIELPTNPPYLQSDFPNNNANSQQPFPNFNIPIPTSIPLPPQVSPNFGPSSFHDGKQSNYKCAPLFSLTGGQQNLSNPPLQRPLPQLYPNNNYPAQRFPPMQIPPPPSMAQSRQPFPQNFNRFPRFPFNNNPNASETLPNDEERHPGALGSFPGNQPGQSSSLASAQIENVQQPFGANSQFNGQFLAGSAGGPGQLLMAHRQQRLMLQQQQRMSQGHPLPLLQSPGGPSNMTSNFQGNQRPFFPGFRPNPQMAQMMGARTSGLNPFFLAGMQNAMRARLLMASQGGGFNGSAGGFNGSAGGHGGNQQQYPFMQPNNIPCGSDLPRQGRNEGISNFEGEDSNSEERFTFEQTVTISDDLKSRGTHDIPSSVEDLHERDWNVECNEKNSFNSSHSKPEHPEPSPDVMESMDNPGMIETPLLENEVATSQGVANTAENYDIKSNEDLSHLEEDVGISTDLDGCEKNEANCDEQLKNSQQSNVDIEGDA